MNRPQCTQAGIYLACAKQLLTMEPRERGELLDLVGSHGRQGAKNRKALEATMKRLLEAGQHTGETKMAQIYFMKHVHGPRVLGFETEQDRDNMVHSLRLSGHTVEPIDLDEAWRLLEPDRRGYRHVPMMSGQWLYRLPPNYLAECA